VRLLYLTMRYGDGILGGAEHHCRAFASRLAARGHTVEVLTSCATDAATWSDALAPGTTDDAGVVVHRLPARTTRHPEQFHQLNRRAAWGARPVPLVVQQAWVHAQGPDLAGFVPWIERHAPRFDAVIAFSYLYGTTVLGLPAAGRSTATVLHPTAHDEPMIDLAVFDLMAAHVDGWALSSEEEHALVSRRFRPRGVTAVIGVGTSLGEPAPADAFRRRHDLGDEPYVVVVGRAAAGKGVDEIIGYQRARRARPTGRTPTTLVVVGDTVAAGADDGVVGVGFVSDQERDEALAGARAIVVPSYFESFSMVLTEAWAQRTAAVVQGRCAPLAGQVGRAGGGLSYRTFSEWDQAVELLATDAARASELGAAGRRYVAARYQWDDVLDGYEVLLERAVARGRDRLGAVRRP
jgi:glycosyltransferase involved in cell wall biosynthesis